MKANSDCRVLGLQDASNPRMLAAPNLKGACLPTAARP